MKLFIQIPCYNEEKTLSITLAALPKNVAGFDSVEVLIIDDGSSDDTVKVAKEFGVKHFVQFSSNQGLARGFTEGLNYCLKMVLMWLSIPMQIINIMQTIYLN